MSGSPSALPIGTRPDAIAPTTVPMKKGVSTDETANSHIATRRPPTRAATSWKAKPAPRSTIPSATRLSGMNSVDVIDENAVGKAVHITTSTKISHTWFASQTGPIARATKE